MHRREFVKLTGAAGLAAAGGYAWFHAEGAQLRAGDDPANGDPAYEAWSQWNNDAGGRPFSLVRAAVVASSPHNTQPWRFRVGEDFVELYLDARRSVAGLDPYLREAHIGMGCGLENLVLSAAAHGLAARLTLPEGPLDPPGPELRLVARVDLTPGERKVSELYEAIPNRHTNRSVYDRSRKLPAGFAQELLSTCIAEDTRVFLFEDSAAQEALVRISSAANLALYSDPKVEAGSEQWVRWRAADAERLKDGLTVENFGLPPVTAAAVSLMPMWMLKRASAPKQRAQMYEGQMRSARLMGVIAVRDRLDQRQSLQAGRVWQRAHLLATARGVAARPCNEAIEGIDHERSLGLRAECEAALGQVLGDATWQPTFLFLMGYPTLRSHRSPRRPAEMVARG
jgi:nitroreductase